MNCTIALDFNTRTQEKGYIKHIEILNAAIVFMFNIVFIAYNSIV